MREVQMLDAFVLFCLGSVVAGFIVIMLLYYLCIFIEWLTKK